MHLPQGHPRYTKTDIAAQLTLASLSRDNTALGASDKNDPMKRVPLSLILPQMSLQPEDLKWVLRETAGAGAVSGKNTALERPQKCWGWSW